MDDETSQAAWFQLSQEQQQRLEDERKLWRKECDEFHDEFNRSMRTLTKGNENANFSDRYWWEGFQKGS